MHIHLHPNTRQDCGAVCWIHNIRTLLNHTPLQGAGRIPTSVCAKLLIDKGYTVKTDN